MAERIQGRGAAMYGVADLPNGSPLAVDDARRWLLIYAYEPSELSPADFDNDRCLATGTSRGADPHPRHPKPPP
ncbi:MAG: hypothetical protein NVSMB55_09010 [Mycobacteriales bacterium]